MTFTFDGFTPITTDGAFTRVPHSGTLYVPGDFTGGPYAAVMLAVSWSGESGLGSDGTRLLFECLALDPLTNTSSPLGGYSAAWNECATFSVSGTSGSFTGLFSGTQELWAGASSPQEITVLFRLRGQFDAPGTFRFQSPPITLVFLPNVTPGGPGDGSGTSPPPYFPSDTDRILVAVLTGASSLGTSRLSADLMPGLALYFDSSVLWRDTSFDFS